MLRILRVGRRRWTRRTRRSRTTVRITGRIGLLIVRISIPVCIAERSTCHSRDRCLHHEISLRVSCGIGTRAIGRHGRAVVAVGSLLPVWIVHVLLQLLLLLIVHGLWFGTFDIDTDIADGMPLQLQNFLCGLFSLK